MPFEPRFIFARGLAKSIVVPKGTLAKLQAHVRNIEDSLGLVAEKYMDNPPHWRGTKPTKEITDEDLCNLARKHNLWVDWLWDMLGKWSVKPPTGETEELTPEGAATIWHGTEKIDVPLERWDRRYYREQMEEMYSIMRGQEVGGVHWGEKPLTPRQAANVLWLIAEHLGIDGDDQRLEAPREWTWDTNARRTKLVQLDEIQPTASYDGSGYEWCERCGAVASGVGGETGCPRRKSQCPIKRERDI